MGPCIFLTRYPFGIALYQGGYTAENVSTAKSIAIYSPSLFYFCPLLLPANSFRLAPRQSVKDSVDLKGDWTQGLTSQPGGGDSEGRLQPFVLGRYTLAASD